MNEYPNIMRAFYLIALDNNGINRYRSKDNHARECIEWLSKYKDLFVTDTSFADIDHWLGTLDEQELEDVCTGEETERDKLFESAPPNAHQFLNQYFDDVC